MIGRGPLTVRDLRELGVRLHEVMGIKVQTMHVPTTDYHSELRRLRLPDGGRRWDGETEFTNNHRFRHHVSVARVA